MFSVVVTMKTFARPHCNRWVDTPDLSLDEYNIKTAKNKAPSLVQTKNKKKKKNLVVGCEARWSHNKANKDDNNFPGKRRKLTIQQKYQNISVGVTK